MPQNATDAKNLYVTLTEEAEILQQQCYFTRVTSYEIKQYERYWQGEAFASGIYLDHSNTIGCSTDPTESDFQKSIIKNCIM